MLTSNPSGQIVCFQSYAFLRTRTWTTGTRSNYHCFKQVDPSKKKKIQHIFFIFCRFCFIFRVSKSFRIQISRKMFLVVQKYLYWGFRDKNVMILLTLESVWLQLNKSDSFDYLLFCKGIQSTYSEFCHQRSHHTDSNTGSNYWLQLINSD